MCVLVEFNKLTESIASIAKVVYMIPKERETVINMYCIHYMIVLLVKVPAVTVLRRSIQRAPLWMDDDAGALVPNFRFEKIFTFK